MENLDIEHQEASFEYNRSLETGDYVRAVVCLHKMMEIALEENRLSDYVKLKHVAEEIINHIAC